MFLTGKIKLPNGKELSTPSGGTYQVGSDTYPVTIVGFSRSGKTVFYRRANYRMAPGHDYLDQEYIYEDHPKAEIKKATWRRRGGFKPVGCQTTYIRTNGYGCYRDPHF